MAKIKSTTQKKPREDFPLFPHSRGYWAKKVRGRLVYFGKIADDPKGEAALNKWLDEKDDLLAGREPRTKTPAGETVRGLCNAFMSHKKALLEAGELCQRTFDDYFATCARLVKAFGRERPVDDLVADDFRHLRAQVAKVWGPVRLSNEIQRVRSVFKYGYDAGILDKTVRFGPDFKKPSAKVLRKNRAGRSRMFEPAELQTVLEKVGLSMKAMILLACNGGLGNADVAGLAFSDVNLKTGWLTYPRPKTGIERRIPLWSETVQAIEAAVKARREPKDTAEKNLIFIGTRGESYVCSNGYRVCQEFVRGLTAAKVTRRGFYSIRHTFQTIGEGARDLSAVQSIMGHAASGSDMSARYRERVDDDRLQAVVRRWLFGTEEKK
jgi:integrase